MDQQQPRPSNPNVQFLKFMGMLVFGSGALGFFGMRYACNSFNNEVYSCKACVRRCVEQLQESGAKDSKDELIRQCRTFPAYPGPGCETLCVNPKVKSWNDWDE